MEELMIKIDNVSKMYKLGQIGGTTLRDELQRKMAKMKGKEDPTKKIGAKDYNKGETFMALNGVSFEVKKGERVGIIGHNGAGKSTLLKLISRVTAPTDGEIGLNGRVASMLEVGTGFHQELTGRENIYMNGAILGMTKAEIDAKMEDIIEFSECRQFIDTPVKRYSSGMYVKLAFSVAAHLDSEIMIMDEVLAVGDMAFQQKCLDKMDSVSHSEGKTILYVSHNMKTIRQLCNRCVVLDHGKKIFDGDVEKAIQYYENVKKNSAVEEDYSDREMSEWLLAPKVKLLHVKFLDKTTPVFYSDEKMSIELTWQNLQRVDNLGLRMEVWSLEKEPIGTFVLYDFYSGDKDEINLMQASLDISSLTDNDYRFVFTFFNRDEYGNNVDLDCVESLYFEMKIKEEKRLLLWEPQYFGYICMPSPVVERIKQVD